MRPDQASRSQQWNSKPAVDTSDGGAPGRHTVRKDTESPQAGAEGMSECMCLYRVALTSVNIFIYHPQLPANLYEMKHQYGSRQDRVLIHQTVLWRHVLRTCSGLPCKERTLSLRPRGRSHSV